MSELIVYPETVSIPTCPFHREPAALEDLT